MATSVPRADGQAHVGPGQGGGVVDAVAHHGHLLAALLELADLLLLILRQHFRHHAVHAHLSADGLSGLFVVAGEHDHFNAHGLQVCDSLLAGGLHHIRYCDHADELTRRSKEQRCLALIRHLILELFQDLVVNAFRVQQFLIACQAGNSLRCLPFDALARGSVQTAPRAGTVCSFFCLGHNSAGQGVF